MKKLLVFGCNGFVGTSLCISAKQDGFLICGADMGNTPVLDGMEYYSCDITQASSVLDVVTSAAPTYVVNVAAIANIDYAEANREQAYAVNVTGAKNIALACKKIGARHLFFSSDAVFDGMTGGYTEDSPKAPVNFYGQTKSDAEDCIFSAYPDSVVIRISLVLGFSPAGGNSFLGSVVKKLEAGEIIECPVSEVRSPIDVSTLCACVLELYSADFHGVVHLACSGSANRYEITRRAAELMGYDERHVKMLSETTSVKAPRHKLGIISITLAQSILKTPLYDINTTIERAVNSRT